MKVEREAKRVMLSLDGFGRVDLQTISWTVDDGGI